MSKLSLKPRFIFITGGVVSSLGKGIVAASTAALMQERGYRVRLRKLDPYLNRDPGTMNPTEHGEVYVTDDGCETDLDLGHYERFTDVPVKKSDNITSGEIYFNLLQAERRGDYLGQTLQVIPHVTNAIKDFFLSDINDEDFIFYEIGGTIGDIESLPFLEAIRQFCLDIDRSRLAHIHLTLLPFLRAANEVKTKPTQHSVRELRAAGIQPDILVCRSELAISADLRKKIASMCSVNPKSVISAPDTHVSIYEAPINYHDEGLDKSLIRHFSCPPFKQRHVAAADKQHSDEQANDKKLDLATWRKIVRVIKQPEGNVSLALVVKYTNELESYKSLVEAISHAGIAHQHQVDIRWVDSETIDEEHLDKEFAGCHGILIPGGFGKRGIEGKVLAAHYAYQQKTPFFGICLGMHSAIIAFARNVLNLPEANSTEFKPDTSEPVIGLMSEWTKGTQKVRRSLESDYGGTMRLGSYPCKLVPGSRVQAIYQNKDTIHERHRHRYEVNPRYRKLFEENGFLFSGSSPDETLLEISEIKDHPWHFSVQYHPELLSRPFRPHPLYASFVEAMINQTRLI